MRARLTRLLDCLPTALALATFILVVLRILRTVDASWDTLAYHWPFAARLAGLCDTQCFTGSTSDESRYAGFPKLWHALQGFLWRLTGSPANAPLLNLAMAGVVCAYLKRRFAVPLAWSWLALIAIPMVQIHLSATYIDLPLNLATTLALLVVLRMIGDPAADHRVDVGIALMALGLAAGSKFQSVPVALLVWLLIVVISALRPASIGFRGPAATIVVLALCGALVLLPKLVMNALEFANPFYPLDVGRGSLHFAGPERIGPEGSIAEPLRGWSNPLRWLASIVEYDAFRGRFLPWSIGQGEVPISSPSYTMGGYFVPYVLGSLALFFWATSSIAKGGWIVALGVALSVLCAFLPHSHELRYYMFWMITLVSTLLALVHSPLFAQAAQQTQRGMVHALVVIAATSVVSMTGAHYLSLERPTLAALLSDTQAVVDTVPEGGTLCVLRWHRRSILFSQLFHPERHYQTRELWGDEPAECSRRLDLGPQ